MLEASSDFRGCRIVSTDESECSLKGRKRKILYLTTDENGVVVLFASMATNKKRLITAVVDDEESDVGSSSSSSSSENEERDDFAGDSSSSSEEKDEIEEQEEEDDNPLNAVGSLKFSTAMKRLLVVDEELLTKPQALFKKKTKIQKMGEAEERHAKELKKKLEGSKEFDRKNLNLLNDVTPTQINLERELKKTATRGVVALFNAIGSHQRVIATTSDPSIQAASKENFLQMLKDKALGGAPAAVSSSSSDKKRSTSVTAAAAPSWKVLQEDYLDQLADEDGDDEEEDDRKGVNLDEGEED